MWLNCVAGLIILGSPGSEVVHIGVSDNVYPILNETIQTELSECQIVESPVPIGSDILIGCSRGLYGQYIYISLVRTGGDDGYLHLNEIEVFMGPTISLYCCMQTIVETYYMRIWLYRICYIGLLHSVNISLSQTLVHETHIISQICLSILQKFNFTSDKH